MSKISDLERRIDALRLELEFYLESRNQSSEYETREYGLCNKILDLEIKYKDITGKYYRQRDKEEVLTENGKR